MKILRRLSRTLIAGGLGSIGAGASIAEPDYAMILEVIGALTVLIGAIGEVIVQVKKAN